mmetsp:Transcript_48091/g.128712  ORF Transcript_48091/g.128712 Transcript_48091/m.128712 type:complete len:248 (+) Transcript_48091:74-817(+)
MSIRLPPCLQLSLSLGSLHEAVRLGGRLRERGLGPKELPLAEILHPERHEQPLEPMLRALARQDCVQEDGQYDAADPLDGNNRRALQIRELHLCILSQDGHGMDVDDVRVQCARAPSGHELDELRQEPPDDLDDKRHNPHEGQRDAQPQGEKHLVQEKGLDGHWPSELLGVVVRHAALLLHVRQAVHGVPLQEGVAVSQQVPQDRVRDGDSLHPTRLEPTVPLLWRQEEPHGEVGSKEEEVVPIVLG